MVVTDSAGRVLQQGHQQGGTNNIAEFLALRMALRYAVESSLREIRIVTDSRNNLAWFKRNPGKSITDHAFVLGIKEDIEKLKTRLEIDLCWARREDNLAGQYLEHELGL